MKECRFCGSCDFSQQSGAYFCADCGTEGHGDQARDQLHDDAATQFSANFGAKAKTIAPQQQQPSSTLSSQHQSQITNQSSGSKEDSQKVLQQQQPAASQSTNCSTENSKNLPWQTYEAFTIIISEMCNYFVQRGADEALFDHTYKIWSLYLHSTGCAFLDNYNPQLDTYSYTSGRMRDIFPSTLILPKIFNYRHNRSRFYSQTSSQKHMEEINDLIDYDVADISCKVDYYKKWKAGVLELFYRQEKRKRIHSRNISIMTAEKCFCMVMIGLFHCYKNYLPMTALFATANSTKFPYNASLELVSEFRNLSTDDTQPFNHLAKLNTLKVIHLSKKLTKFLQIDADQEYRTMMRSTLIESLYKLNLPMDLVQIIESVAERIMEMRQKSSALHQSILPASILISLLALFNVSSYKAMQDCRIAVDKFNCLPHGYKLFSFLEWFDLSLKVSHIPSSNRLHNANIDIEYLKNHVNSHEDLARIIERRFHYTSSPHLASDYRPKRVPRHPKLFPKQIKDFLSNRSLLNDSLEQDLHISKRLKKEERLQKNFKNLSLEHILNAKSFNRKLQNFSTQAVGPFPEPNFKLTMPESLSDCNLVVDLLFSRISELFEISPSILFDDTRKILQADLFS